MLFQPCYNDEYVDLLKENRVFSYRLLHGYDLSTMHIRGNSETVSLSASYQSIIIITFTMIEVKKLLMQVDVHNVILVIQM